MSTKAINRGRKSSLKASASVIVIALLTGSICLALPTAALSSEFTGPALTFGSNKGNCLACHVISGGEQMGDIGPPLENMRLRFPDRERLRAQIWDAGQFNINSLMPPFGRHRILSEQEIDLVIDFLYTR